MVKEGAPGMQVIAICDAQISQTFVDAEGTKVVNDEDEEGIVEVEAAVFPDSRVFFVQGHPEVGTPEYRSWTMTKLQDYMIEWGKIPEPRQIADVPFLSEKVIG
jgi:hypothetical protein